MTDAYEGDLGTCPYLARWGREPGHDPDATCSFGCHDEPECVTCRPPGGWPSEVERFGMWVGSEAGVSFHCQCGWVSSLRPTADGVRIEIARHAESNHGTLEADAAPDTPTR